MITGGVPVATLNLQVGVSQGETVPDAWHHQMIFGVGEQGVYLTNPLECVSDSLLSDQLCSPSVLLVRRADIISRWNREGSLQKMLTIKDSRWKEMNVLGKNIMKILKNHSSSNLVKSLHNFENILLKLSFLSTSFYMKNKLTISY